jgi:hypothetical protein
MSPSALCKMTMAALVQGFRERHTHTPFAGGIPTRGGLAVHFAPPLRIFPFGSNGSHKTNKLIDI